MDKSDVDPINDIPGSKLIERIFTMDIFGEDFIAPKHDPTGLMEFVSLQSYFENIDEMKADKYVSFAYKLIDDPNFEHYCSEPEAAAFKALVETHLEDSDLSRNEYGTAIRYLERKALLNNYKDGVSVMFPISVGAYYTMAVFISLKDATEFTDKLKLYILKTDKKGQCKFWSIQKTFEKEKAEEIRSKIMQLYLYVNQLPMMMLTKLYSLFPQYEPSLSGEDLLQKGLSLILCIPNDKIKISSKEKAGVVLSNEIKIDLGYKTVVIPYRGDPKFKDMTSAQVGEIVEKVYELQQNIEKKGAVDIAASLAHSLRHTLTGFSESLYSIYSEKNTYAPLLIKGYSVVRKIEWLNIVNPKADKASTKVDLIEILVLAFNFAWCNILTSGGTVKGLPLTTKFKDGNR